MILPAIRQCRDLLKSLGTNANEVAQSLTEKKITGFRKHGNNCPIANYLKQESDKELYLYFSVSPISIVAYDLMSNVSFAIPTPTPIHFFVKDFDRGNYPYLELP